MAILVFESIGCAMGVPTRSWDTVAASEIGLKPRWGTNETEAAGSPAFGRSCAVSFSQVLGTRQAWRLGLTTYNPTSRPDHRFHFRMGPWQEPKKKGKELEGRIRVITAKRQ
jgi:hypothetical protein